MISIIKIGGGSIYRSVAVLLIAIVVMGFSGERLDWGRDVRAALTLDTPEKPNIVFVLTDDARSDTYDEMPALQDLAANGTTFGKTTNVYPLCCPSRATLLTGDYAHNHRLYDNAGEYGGWERFRELGLGYDTVATRLDNAGYETAMVGKYLNNYYGKGIPPGWDRWYAETDLEREGGTDYRINDEGEIKEFSGTFDANVKRESARFVSENAAKDAPFFLTASFNAPHVPSEYQDQYADMFGDRRVPRSSAYKETDLSDKPEYVREAPSPVNSVLDAGKSRGCDGYETSIGQNDCIYRNMLRSLQTVDASIAQMRESLREAGELDNTVFLYYPDNGLHLGEHNLNKQGKDTPYLTDTRTPLIASGPGFGDGSSDALIGSHDIPATIADLGGASASGMDGTSLLRDGALTRSAILSERIVPEIPEGYVPTSSRRVPGWKALYTATEVYVEYKTGEREYYRLDEDPHQLHNRAGDFPWRERQLAERIDALKNCSGAECRAAEGPG